MHNSFVDCVRWYGDLVVSKSVDSPLTFWQADVRPPARPRAAPSSRVNAGGSDVQSGSPQCWSDPLAVMPRALCPHLSIRVLFVRLGCSAAAVSPAAPRPAALPRQPDPSRKGQVSVTQQLAIRDTDLWFIRFAFDGSCRTLACGNRAVRFPASHARCPVLWGGCAGGECVGHCKGRTAHARRGA